MYKENLFTFLKKICILPKFNGRKSVFCQILRVKKSVCTDKTSMSGRSGISMNLKTAFFIKVNRPVGTKVEALKNCSLHCNKFPFFQATYYETEITAEIV